MADDVIELVIFKTVDGTGRDSVLEAVHDSNQFLLRQGGFRGRRFCLTEAGDYWVDVVHWSDLDAAHSAAQEFVNAPECKGFASMLDMESTQSFHLFPILEVTAR